MKVKDFITLETSGAIYQIVDATKPGYLRDDAKVVFEADRNVIADRYGRCEVKGFKPKGKKVVLYCGERLL